MPSGMNPTCRHCIIINIIMKRLYALYCVQFKERPYCALCVRQLVNIFDIKENMLIDSMEKSYCRISNKVSIDLLS